MKSDGYDMTISTYSGSVAYYDIGNNRNDSAIIWCVDGRATLAVYSAGGDRAHGWWNQINGAWNQAKIVAEGR
jgi:hypothetical protein